MANPDRRPAERVTVPDFKRWKGEKRKIAGHGYVNVAGKLAMEASLQVDAAPRGVASIAQLKGRFSVVAPSRMLTFVFERLQATPQSAKQEGVQVTLSEITTEPQRWVVEVTIDNPPGGPKFENTP